LRTLVLVAVASAFVGGAAGAGVTLFATSSSSKHPSKHPSTPSSGSTAAPDDRSLEERLASVEDAVRALERRRSPLAGVTAPSDAGATPGQPTNAAAEAPSLVDDPVFEAAVRDVMERAEGDRDSERELRREDRRKQEVTRWTDDIAARLGLNEQQKQKVLEIAQEFTASAGKLWQADGGAPPPREQRRAEVQKLREQTVQKLRGVLDEKQARAYDALPEEDQLGLPRRGFGVFRRDPGALNR
jgi:hypothetical protein